MRDVGRELAAARVSASPGLVHCRQGPPALPPLLSAGSAAAKKQLNKALFICADCIHCTSQPLGCGTTQICLALQRKGLQTCSQQQSAWRCQGCRSIGDSVPALSDTADPTTPPLHPCPLPTPSPSIIHVQRGTCLCESHIL